MIHPGSTNKITSFETALVVSKWDKKIGPWRGRVAFFNYIFGILFLYIIFSARDDMSHFLRSTNVIVALVILLVTLSTSGILFYLTSKTEMEGAVKIHDDHLLLVGKISEQQVFYKDVDSIKFERHSDYHRQVGYEVPKKHGNKLFIVKNGIKTEYEFVLNSEAVSHQFNNFMIDLQQKWPTVLYTTC